MSSTAWMGSKFRHELYGIKKKINNNFELLLIDYVQVWTLSYFISITQSIISNLSTYKQLRREIFNE